MVQPSRWTRWPITHSAPTRVGWRGVTCSTEPSWIELRPPMVMAVPSPRSTAPGHTDASGPSVTLPMSTASGCTSAVGSMSGSVSPSA